MILRKRFFVSSLYLSVLLGPCLAIFDPSATTVKPPNRREPVLPWYLDGVNTQPVEDGSRSAKWNNNEDQATPRRPVTIDGRPDIWTPWRKAAGSEIEQRTEIHGSPQEQDQTGFDQIGFDQWSDTSFSSSDGGSQSQDNGQINGQNEYINEENTQIKTPPKDSKLHVELETEGEDLYEGVASDSKKPRGGKISVNKKPKRIVAKYDSTHGVQCPDADATGQFVYPLDCKFFVNCWQGRAFVQPCAPGTLFNPETLECDFPFKVKCYGEEVADLAAPDDPRAINREPSSSNRGYLTEEKLQQEPTCPSQVTGLFSHPTDCTKFLQCANGGAVVMDCGPGTVFNPAISVCDWPRNVPGCEDALKSQDEDTAHPVVPPNPNTYGYSDHAGTRAEYNVHQNEKRISCPADFTGLLPHPDTCYKFLQCHHGGTFVKDCGPGTAFNPETSVCDWPYNVPSCREGKTISSQGSGHSSGTWGTGHETTQFGHSSWNPTSGSSQHGSGSWNPSSGSSQHGSGTWNPSSGSSSQGSWNPHSRPTQSGQGSWHGTSHSGQGSWQTGHNEHVRTSTISPRPTWRPTWRPNYYPNNQGGYNNEEHTPEQHFGGYHHHHHDHNHQFDNENDDYTSHTTDDYYNHDHHYGPQSPAPEEQPPNYERPPPPPYPHHNHHQDHSGSWNSPQNHQPSGAGGNDRQIPDTNYDQSQISYGENPYRNTYPGHVNNQTRGGNRGNYGRTNPHFPYSGSNNSGRPGGHVHFDNRYNESQQFPNRNQTTGGYYPHHGSYNRTGYNRNTWSQPEVPGNRPGGFRPSYGPGSSRNSSQGQWNQEEPPFPVYYVPPVQPLHVNDGSKFLTPISGQIIRLRGGRGPSDGYVEVQGTHPGWGIVCDSRNGWTLKEAHVVCRQLGYIRGAEMAWQGRNNVGEVPSWIAANTVSCSGNETLFQTCKFTHEQTCRVERDAIGVRCFPNRVAHCRKDEIPHEGQCYHLADPESSLNHAEALNYCSNRNARLLDVTNQAENTFISEWLTQKYPEVASVMTSGVGFNMLSNTIWLWEDSSRAKFKFSKWWPGWLGDKNFPPRVGSRPVCVILKRKFPCHERPDSTCVADYFFWDVEDCAANMKGHSYICKRPYDDIGCVYGKGNQYAGTANVTASGAECLPWNDEKVAHSLLINVVSREMREKLKTHNYCRNPNPYKESRPWCFSAPNGRREYCDIPPCGNVGSKRSLASGTCKPKHFQCQPGECIPSPWVCDGEEDCTNGADERTCLDYVNLFKKTSKRKLEGHDVEKWLNTPLKTCALRCKEADFTCRSFSHKADENICLLSDNNVGMSGALTPSRKFDYYEMIDRSLDCTGMFVCDNGKCINQTQVCNGKNDCNDRSDEKICTVANLDYDIRLAGSNNDNEGRIDVKVFGYWGQVCDDGFGMANAHVVCKELGFELGALEVKPGGTYGNLDPPTRFMVDQLKCRGNETSLRECDFEGWGVHNCEPEEAVGVVCKTGVDVCQEDHWKCDKSPTCIPTHFLCDEVVDCPDGSDESGNHCDAPFMIRLANGSNPMEGRVEVRHHGVWGTVCDDDFTNTAASVVCKALGYNGKAFAKKNGFFGPGDGPIWLDEVSCSGNETQLYRCEHKDWGLHNCDHTEDVGVVCTEEDVNHPESSWGSESDISPTYINDLLPSNCGKRAKDFDEDEDMIFARVVRGSIAPKGAYPWQASIRVRGRSRSNHWCGAVIISPLHVLTAAHCLQGYNKASYYVRAGDYNTEIDEGTEVEANIEDYYIHERFRKGHKMNNDIALVLLKGSGIPLGKHIMPICLPPEDADYPDGLNCTISGFGTFETGRSSQSYDLRYGWVPLVDQTVCGSSYVYGREKITDGMVCAGYLDEGVDACEGDSGGPLACPQNGAFTLYGITSWGQKCGQANKPGVYVRVAYYRQWIDQKIRESLTGR